MSMRHFEMKSKIICSKFLVGGKNIRWGDKISDPYFARTNPRIAEKIKPSTLATLYLF